MQTQLETRPSAANVWWRSMRPHTLTAAFIPVITGTAMALFDQQASFILFIAMLIASLLIQGATNLVNEYYDYVRGLDNDKSVGIGGTIVRDGVAPVTIKRVAILFYAISVALGVYICMESSWWVAALGVLSILVSYFYSAGPLPISSTPFGEFFSGFFMGPVIIMITYYIQTLDFSWDYFLVSFSVGILIGAINMSNNIRDREGDQVHGRKTLPILLGHDKAVFVLGCMFAAAYVLIVTFVLLQHITPWTLIVLLSLPKAIKTVRLFKGKQTPIEMMPGMKSTGILNTMFGFLLTIGFLIGYFAG